MDRETKYQFEVVKRFEVILHPCSQAGRRANKEPGNEACNHLRDHIHTTYPTEHTLVLELLV